MQGTLERIPDKRLAEHLLCFKNQETTIGPVQGAGAQLTVGGVKRALVGAVFNPTKQIVIGWVRLKHYRRTTTYVMADDQAWCVLLLKQFARLGVGLAVIDQLLDHCA
ncbi:hypothetical protein D3C77_331220 [compost metagenome]